MKYSIDDLISTIDTMLEFKTSGPNPAVSMAMEVVMRSRLDAIRTILVAAKKDHARNHPQPRL